MGLYNQRTYRNMNMIWPMSKGQTAARKRKDSAPFYSWLDAEWSKCFWSLSASFTERNVYYIISYINPIINKLSIKNNFDLLKEPPQKKKNRCPKELISPWGNKQQSPSTKPCHHPSHTLELPAAKGRRPGFRPLASMKTDFLKELELATTQNDPKSACW